jgi:AcrR family transcriptional regulator
MVRPDPPACAAGITSVDSGEARPLRADARRNRDRVLEAARAAFGAEGSDVSLDEIARRAGVGAGTVYRHFATKEALFEAVVFDRIGELVEEASASSDDPDPGRAFSSFVERLAREGALKRDLVEALAYDGIHLQLGEAPIVRALTDALAELLRRAQRAGAVRSDISVDDVVALLTGAAYAICHSRADDERTRRLLAIMYDGLRADRTAKEMPPVASSENRH